MDYEQPPGFVNCGALKKCNRFVRGGVLHRMFWRHTIISPFRLGVVVWIFSSLCAAEAGSVAVTLRLPGGAVQAEVFEPVGSSQRKPVVLVLHGAGGTLLDGPEMRRVARRLAEEGNAVYFLHYFERTGTIFALDSTMQRHFRAWLETVRDAIPAIQELRSDAAPIGIYGYSLGGFLALLAASDNPRVGAVVEHAGGVWNGQMDRIGRMPPVLMVHGERDRRVPFAKYAKPLLPVLRKHAPVVREKTFPVEGHVFTPAAMMEVRAAAAGFFRAHLRGGR